jgi:hypothetical protein
LFTADLLDELLGLDVAHTVDTGDTVTIELLSEAMFLDSIVYAFVIFSMELPGIFDVPDGENATSLGETGLLGNTADALLEDRGDLSGCGLVGIAAGLPDGGLVGRGGKAGLLW